ncbi:MAG: 4Fe-4S dicluster domain-containing protein [Acidobacteria bacterium]|nr:4Fe-4S dicluster domain-containing protein [Acidobacteriota bacterium]
MTIKLQTAPNTEMDKILGCIHCGLCLPACPTYQQLGNENDSPRGRIYLMRAVAEGRLPLESASFNKHIDLCLGCRACETACPAGVNYGFLLEAAREDLLHTESADARGTLQKTMLKLTLRHVFPYPWRLRVAFFFMRLARGFFLTKWLLRSGLLRTLAPSADFAASLLDSTTPHARRRGAKTKFEVDDTRPVTVFTGCVMQGLFKSTNEATARVLAVNGSANTRVKAQVCCGALHAHAGDIETARELARRNIDAFERSAPNTTIIINAAGCGALLKEYGELLKHDALYAERARTFSARVKDVTEFLAALIDAGGFKTGAPLDQRVTYDAPCHLYHAQRVLTAPQKLLAAIPGLEYKQLEGFQDCCGGAGIYNLSEPEMSNRLLSDKINKVKATGAEVLVTANPGCHMQLSAGARLFEAECRIAHLVELLDESYQRAGFYEAMK